MSSAPLPPPMPELEPLQLLYVTNGSPLTADRWWLAHHYYQHRQNLHYQSLHQPGIVRGLGVRVIAAPTSVPSELRDDRWLEIQPGLAIDLTGNPIVVEAPVSFRITAEVLDEPVTVYVVLAYVNPREKQWTGLPADVVKEDFRINERTTPPAPTEVELCRLVLTRNTAPLQNAIAVLQPTAQELDLRYRQRARSRSPYPVQLGLFSPSEDSPYPARLAALLQSLTSLYPALAGATEVTPVTLSRAAAATLAPLTLLFLPYAAAIALSAEEVAQLQRYIAQGGTVLVEYTDGASDRASLSELQAVQGELLVALSDLETVETGTELDQIRQDLMAEFVACEAALQAQLQAIAQPIAPLAQPLGDAAARSPESPPVAPIPTQTPFLFDALPSLPTGPLQLMAWEGVVLVIGPLSAAWTSRQFEAPLPRTTLRSAQELGINLLYQASQRQQLMQAQQAVMPEVRA